jgi:hypothetical protein
MQVQNTSITRAHPRSQRVVGEAFCPAVVVQTLALSGRCSASGGLPVSLTSVGTSVGPGERNGTSLAFASPQGRRLRAGVGTEKVVGEVGNSGRYTYTGS